MTTVRVPKIEMGRKAAALLLNLVAGKSDMIGVRLDTILSSVDRLSLFQTKVDHGESCIPWDRVDGATPCD